MVDNEKLVAGFGRLTLLVSIMMNSRESLVARWQDPEAHESMLGDVAAALNLAINASGVDKNALAAYAMNELMMISQNAGIGN